LVIRENQMDAFRDSLHAEYVRRLMRRMRDRFASQFAAMPESALRQWVDLGLAKARRYGYDRENEVELFIDLCAECGLDFDRQPWATAILSDTTLGSREKLVRVDDYVVFVLRNAK